MGRSNWKSAAKRLYVVAMALTVAILMPTPGRAVIDPSHQFVVNGGFETTTSYGQLRSQNATVAGWTNNNDGQGNRGFTYVMNAQNALTGTPGEATLKLWQGGVNGGATLSASPTGGNFIGADGAYHVGKLTQTISGLIVGQTYQLTFNFAGAQEYGYDGASTDSWKFGFNSQGSNFQQTAILNNVNHGFTGWQTQTYNFVATQATDTLYFLAAGTPAGQPPFSLLDSVSLIGAYENGVVTAPEPETWLMMLIGFGMLGMVLRRRAPATGAMPQTAFA